MTKIGKKLAAILLAVAMVVTFVPVIGTQTAYADKIVKSGTCGDDLTWVLDSEGTLTVYPAAAKCMTILLRKPYQIGRP